MTLSLLSSSSMLSPSFSSSWLPRFRLKPPDWGELGIKDEEDEDEEDEEEEDEDEEDEEDTDEEDTDEEVALPQACAEPEIIFRQRLPSLASKSHPLSDSVLPARK